MAGEGIEGALPAMPAVKAHFRALPYQEVAAALNSRWWNPGERRERGGARLTRRVREEYRVYFDRNATQSAAQRCGSAGMHRRSNAAWVSPQAVKTVDGSKASKAAKLCLRFLILTAARSGEARGATWVEVDSEAREWRIPGERMKGGASHRVPLSDAALAVLERARALDDGSGLIFPSPLKPGRPLSPMTLTKILRDQGLAERGTVHGFRSSFRDWCAETGKPREVAEAALAHTVGGVEGAYFRSDLYARRRVLMDQWAAFLTGRRGKW